MNVGDVVTAYWFRPKRYGYGATPNTWQGWTVTAAIVLIILAATLLLQTLGGKSSWSLVLVLAIAAVAVSILVIVIYRKTEGGWHWRWGDPKNSEKAD